MYSFFKPINNLIKGIRTIKEQFNVRKGRLINSDTNEKITNNKSFEFVISIDDAGLIFGSC